MSLRFNFTAFALAVLLPGCTTAHGPLETFSQRQKGRLHEGATYIQADFDFWASVYEPSLDDLEGLRQSWVQHGEAFPESKTFAEVEQEVRKSSQKTVLVALFMTSYELADLKDKSLGWGVHPIPAKIKELSSEDVVLRTLMPVKNEWARYFLLTYSPSATLLETDPLVISNRTSRLGLSLRR